MPPSSQSATIQFKTNGAWSNIHKNVGGVYERYYSITGPEDTDEALIIEDMKAAVTAFQEILRDAIAEGKKLRVIGGTWSLSAAAYTHEWLLITETIDNTWRMRQQDVLAGYTGDITNLFLMQCGKYIESVNRYLAFYGKALQTSGASNGQTIAGAIATGTHGSALRYGAMPEYVVGIHLIPDPEQSIWLERASHPVISDDFAASLGVTIQRDDNLFNAALVSFGSFGIVAGLMIEATPIYLLNSTTYLINKNLDEGLLKQAMSTMDSAALSLLDADNDPWHFEITFNPHDTTQRYAKKMYKQPFPVGFQNPPPTDDELSPGENLLGVIAKLGQVLPPFGVGILISELLKKNFKLETKLMTPGGIFDNTTTHGKAFSMELGVDMKDAGAVFDILTTLHPEIDHYAGVISFRWVKKSSAMLGFTKFDTTTTIEFNASANQSTLNYYNRIWNELTAQGVNYTVHWGQMNNFTPAGVVNMYSQPVVQKWMECRDQLMSPAAKAVFSNDYLASTGLG